MSVVAAGSSDESAASRLLLLIVGLALSCLFAVFLATAWSGLLAMLVVLAVAAIGLALVAALGASAADQRFSKNERLRFIAAMPILSLALWYGGIAAVYWGHVAPSAYLLASERAALDKAVRDRSGGTPRSVLGVERAGERVAFVTRNVMLGAWSGLVFDPTNRLIEARGWGGGPFPAEVAHSFGSRTMWCRGLGGHYFHCNFD